MRFLVQFLVVGFFAIGLISSSVTENVEEDGKVRGLIDSIINATINKIVQNISDPIAVDTLELNFTDDSFKGDAGISQFQLYGIKNLVATFINVSITAGTLNATVELPRINLNTDYHANVTIAGLIPFYGSGLIGVTINGIELSIFGNVEISGLSVKGFSNLAVLIGLDSAQFDLHGLLDNEDLSLLVDEVLSDTLVPFINDNKELISDLIGPVVESLLNSIFNSSSVEALEFQREINSVLLD